MRHSPYRAPCAHTELCKVHYYIYLSKKYKPGKPNCKAGARLHAGNNENNPEALTYFLIEAIKSNQENSEDNLILDRARSLNYLKPSRDSLTLLLTAFMRSQQYQNAYNLIQKLMILNPHMISKYRSILEKLKTCIK